MEYQQIVAAMNWVTDHLGAEAILEVGLSTRDHARAAIQYLSDSVARRSVFTHTGWRQVGGGAVYLHGGGGIGPDGPVAGLETRLDGGLTRFALPAPPDGDELREAVSASLALLDAAPARVAAALLAMVYRAPLGQVDFSGFLVGPSGAGKSELAALAQQHYGAAMDRLHLPASWSSTGNALEGVAFQAKDALLVIDDFAPTGTINDVQRLHREAERLLRAQGNASARMRMRADTTLRPPKPPRGLLLGTGEDVPRGQSLRARVLVIEVSPGDVRWNHFGRLQEQAARGTLAAATAGYLRWLAPEHQGESERVQARFQELRQLAVGATAHRPTPDMIANLAIGFERFLQFAVHVGAIDAAQQQELWERGWRSLVELGEAQGDHIRSAEPTTRFLELLAAALASGDAHVAAPSGDAPESAVSWGWRQRTFGSGDHETERWEPQGYRIGWLSGPDLYLEPGASFAVCQRIGQTTAEPLTVNQTTLEKRLRERGLLVSVDKGRLRVRVRGLEGKRRAVIHLASSTVFSDGDTTAPAATAKASDTRVGTVGGRGPVDHDGSTAPRNGHQRTAFELGDEEVGTVGAGGRGSGRGEGDSIEGGEEMVEWRA